MTPSHGPTTRSITVSAGSAAPAPPANFARRLSTLRSLSSRSINPHRREIAALVRTFRRGALQLAAGRSTDRPRRHADDIVDIHPEGVADPPPHRLDDAGLRRQPLRLDE